MAILTHIKAQDRRFIVARRDPETGAILSTATKATDLLDYPTAMDTALRLSHDNPRDTFSVLGEVAIKPGDQPPVAFTPDNRLVQLHG